MIFRDINGNILNISKNDFENMNLYYKKLFNISQKYNYCDTKYNIVNSFIDNPCKSISKSQSQLHTIVSKIQSTLFRK